MAEPHAHPHSHAHTDEEERKLEPKVEMSDVGPCKIKLRIEIAAERVHDEIEHKYEELNESVALPGFRKGKAPRMILEKKFGKAMLELLPEKELIGLGYWGLGFRNATNSSRPIAKVEDFAGLKLLNRSGDGS